MNTHQLHSHYLDIRDIHHIRQHHNYRPLPLSKSPRHNQPLQDSRRMSRSHCLILQSINHQTVRSSSLQQIIKPASLKCEGYIFFFSSL